MHDVYTYIALGLLGACGAVQGLAILRLRRQVYHLKLGFDQLLNRELP